MDCPATQALRTHAHTHKHASIHKGGWAISQAITTMICRPRLSGGGQGKGVRANGGDAERGGGAKLKISAEISGVSYKFDGGRSNTRRRRKRERRSVVIVKAVFKSRLMMATRQVRRPPPSLIFLFFFTFFSSLIRYFGCPLLPPPSTVPLASSFSFTPPPLSTSSSFRFSFRLPSPSSSFLPPPPPISPPCTLIHNRRNLGVWVTGRRVLQNQQKHL